MLRRLPWIAVLLLLICVIGAELYQRHAARRGVPLRRPELVVTLCREPSFDDFEPELVLVWVQDRSAPRRLKVRREIPYSGALPKRIRISLPDANGDLLGMAVFSAKMPDHRKYPIFQGYFELPKGAYQSISADLGPLDAVRVQATISKGGMFHSSLDLLKGALRIRNGATGAASTLSYVKWGKATFRPKWRLAPGTGDVTTISVDTSAFFYTFPPPDPAEAEIGVSEISGHRYVASWSWMAGPPFQFAVKRAASEIGIIDIDLALYRR